MNYLKKRKKELRLEDRSHIAMPKRGSLPCQLELECYQYSDELISNIGDMFVLI